MRCAEWHARIECGGKVAGSGFLVTRDKVLTCAHVVGDDDRSTVTVSFPQRPASEPVPARVLTHGCRPGRPADQGDLAVLVISSSAAELGAADSIGLLRIGYARTPSADQALRTTGCDLVLGSLEPLLEAARSLCPRPFDTPAPYLTIRHLFSIYIAK